MELQHCQNLGPAKHKGSLSVQLIGASEVRVLVVGKYCVAQGALSDMVSSWNKKEISFFLDHPVEYLLIWVHVELLLPVMVHLVRRHLHMVGGVVFLPTEHEH